MLKKIAKGFTLIELMIVVAIIGILAAIAIPNFVKFQCRSKRSEAKTNLKAMYVAQESYRGENDSYVDLSSAQIGSNLIGFSPQGDKKRYDYSAGAENTGQDFTAQATGTKDSVSGDVWLIDNTNSLRSTTTTICD